MASDHELFIEYGTCAVASVRRDSKRGKARASNWAARDPVRETSALWGWDLEHFVSGTAVGPIHVMDGLRVGIRTYWEARSPNSSGELRFPRGRSCSCSHRACCKAVLDERCDALARDQSSSRELGSHSGRDFLQQRAKLREAQSSLCPEKWQRLHVGVGVACLGRRRAARSNVWSTRSHRAHRGTMRPTGIPIGARDTR